MIIYVSALYILDGVNKFTRVLFKESTKSFICQFLNESLTGQRSCTANITNGTHCEKWLGMHYGKRTQAGDSVTIILPELFTDGTIDFCFEINATIGSLTAIVEGNLQFTGSCMAFRKCIMWLLTSCNSYFSLTYGVCHDSIIINTLNSSSIQHRGDIENYQL